MKRLAAVVLALAMGIAAEHIAAQPSWPSPEEDSAPAKLEQYIRDSLAYVPELANNKKAAQITATIRRLAGGPPDASQPARSALMNVLIASPRPTADNATTMP